MANFITLFRLPLLLAYVLLLYSGNRTLQLWDIPVLVLLLAMDTLDGMTARSLKQVSLLGSVLDIAVDRAVELVLWVVFANFNLISIVIPLVIIVRGVTVDAVRAVGLKDGEMPFHQVRSRISRFLVASPYMRSSYGIIKGLAFLTLTVVLSFRTPTPPSWEQHLLEAAQIISWLAALICLVRGLPVLIEGFRYLKSQGSTTTGNS